ncbi:MAG: MATE family efflux transporter [Butyricicoccus sp.]
MKQAKKAKSYEVDLTSGPILKQMIVFAAPIMASSTLQVLFNAVDTIVVGRFAGDNALAAVGSNTSLITLLTNLFIGLSVGANIVAARYFGAKDQKKVHDTVHTAILLGLLSGIILTLIGVIGAKQILIWMQVPNDVLNLSVIYLRIYFLGMTATMVYNFGSALLRSIGDTKRTLYYLSFAGVVNVVLNLIFVIVFHMSVAGVALATVISQCISAVLVIRCLMHETGNIQLGLRDLKLYPQPLKEIIAVGLPASVQGMVFSFANVVIQSSINSFGSVILAGNSAAASIEGFIYLPVNAFYQATMPFISQNVGAKKYDRLNRVFWAGILCVIVVGEVLGNGAILLSKPLLSIYTTNPDVIAAGQIRFRSYFFIYGIYGTMEVLVGAIRGLGYALLPTIVYITGVCGLRLLWIATIFQIPQFHTIQMLYYAFPFTWFVSIAALAICYAYALHDLRKKADHLLAER